MDDDLIQWFVERWRVSFKFGPTQADIATFKYEYDRFRRILKANLPWQ